MNDFNRNNTPSLHFGHSWQQSKWECLLVKESLILRVKQGHEPNAFHRLMQRLILGFIWRLRA